MNSTLFEWWFEMRLLNEVKSGSVIVLDNATFHRKTIPLSSLRETAFRWFDYSMDSTVCQELQGTRSIKRAATRKRYRSFSWPA